MAFNLPQPPVKRQHPVRNRNNSSPTTPSKRANRLPVLPELSGEHHVSFPSPSKSSYTPSHSTPKMKRLSRYGRNEFGAFSLTDDFLSTVPRAAPKPPSSPPSSSSSTKSMHRSVRLSSFDIVIDISASEPEIPPAACTPPRSRDIRRLSPPRSRSPTPSLTSMSACSSTEMPLTPGASDDESPGLRLPSKKAAVLRPRISKHPLMIKSLSAPDADSEDTFEFTLGPFSPLPGLEAEAADEEEDEDDDALWYSHELSQIISLPSPRDSSNGRARPDSLLPMPRGASSGTPLPGIPPTSVPNPQLDPTFPQSMTLPPHLTLRASDHPSEPSPLALPSPVAPSAPHKSDSTSHRKSLTITVPRTTLQNKITVSDILDDINAWSLATPSASTSSSTCTSTLVLSPPRIPHSPALSQSSDYDPVEFIVSYAARPASPAPSLSETACTEMPATFLDLEDDDDEDDKIRSRWSCSTIATLAPPTTSSPPSPSFAAASARLRLHLASVARRVRIRRAGRSGSGERTASIHSAEGTLHVRSSSESDKLSFGL
jgi:hypothetical protein